MLLQLSVVIFCLTVANVTDLDIGTVPWMISDNVYDLSVEATVTNLEEAINLLAEREATTRANRFFRFSGAATPDHVMWRRMRLIFLPFIAFRHCNFYLHWN